MASQVVYPQNRVSLGPVQVVQADIPLLSTPVAISISIYSSAAQLSQKLTLSSSLTWTLEPMSDPIWKDRRVAVIGCGSSGTQVVPELRPYVKHLDNYVRGRTWISQPFALGFLQKYPDWETRNHIFTDEEKRMFREQPEVYKEMLMQLEDFNHSVHSATHVGTKMENFLRSTYESKMREKLTSRPDIAETLIPDFPLICRRMTFGVGYLESLCADNVTFVPNPITRVTPDGIETSDGTLRRCDIIITATGFDTTFQISGPNSGVATGSLIMTIEAQSDYVVSCIENLQRQLIKYMVPKKKSVDDFQAYLDSYFPKTVWARKCRTWYKAGKEDGKVTALWPGSSLHQYQALQQPRFEDYDYKFLYGEGDPAKVNCLYWL
ncbi:hypothetical protein BDY19DRAFT_905762 [Irpex rosettiformis]|uniref:Uncharacterized protein n=1 Tax=Irpex rosettiformis TaxID=378272 RepID=A0ACB8U4W7_9APHY|nr:hypothetical protein BDY19DRAFT_905762 [Irpex rosettiformis]